MICTGLVRDHFVQVAIVHPIEIFFFSSWKKNWGHIDRPFIHTYSIYANTTLPPSGPNSNALTLCHRAKNKIQNAYGIKTLTLKFVAYISKIHTHTHLVCRCLVLVELCLSGVRAACCSSVQWWMSVDLESALEKRAGVLSHPLQTLRKQQEPAERLQSKELRSEQPMRDIKNNSSPALLCLSSVFIAVCFEVVCFHQCFRSFQWRTLGFKTLSECFKH